MTNLLDLKNKLISNSSIGLDDVKEIRELIFEDGKIDSDEANFLFYINNKFSSANNHTSWSELFIDGICSFLLQDENSPDNVDEKEADWLLKHIESDGKIDPVEKELLKTLKNRSKSIPKNLEDYINKNV
ncbi:MAG: TerB family tellurite resistance protein [Bacteroidetes bacterium]|nr:TerB family tellurite resistance protein [Bacteroidota bacterium]